MSLSPNSSLVQQTIDLKFADRQRASAIKWMCINAALFLIFTWDLWRGRGGRAGALHWAQAGAGAACAAAALRHAARLAARARARAAPRALSPRQRRLLGLRDDADARDSSFCVPEAAAPAPGAAEEPEPASLSPPREWRARAAAPPAAPPEPAAPAPRDLFIADAGELRRYLRSVEQAGAGAEPAPAPAPGAYGSPAAPLYQLSAARAPAAGRGPGPAPPLASPAHLDPARLAHYNLNLRRWLHATVVARLARELDACGAALARAGLAARPGAAAPARLAALAAAAPAPLAARLRALLPFLRPFADQAYVTARVHDLARGGCLAAYRWDGGGAGWDESRPTDAELVLHLFAAYMDSMAPGGAGGAGGEAGAGAFSAAHLSAAPGAPPRAAGALALHRARRSPPHYLVALGARLLDAGAGRDNLLHSLLLLLAAAAARRPPALLRLHLGPAGLNMLWILER